MVKPLKIGRIESTEKKFYIIDEGETTHDVAETTAYLWNLCNGESSVLEIADKFRQDYVVDDTPSDTLTDIVSDGVFELEKMGLVRFE